MKILVFCWRDIKHPWAGGAELYIHEISKHLISKGHTVTMLTSQHPGIPAPQKENLDGIEVVRVGGRFSVYIKTALYYLKNLKGRFDIIVDVENGVSFFTPLYAKEPVIGLVHHVHSTIFFTELQFPLNLIGYVIETLLMPIAYLRHNFIAVSNSTREALIKIGIKEKSIGIVNPGINPRAFDSALEVEKTKTPSLVYLGRLKKYKRPHLVIEAAKALVRDFPNLEVFIMGEGDDRPHLDTLIDKYGLKKHVHLLGFTSEAEKAKLLKSAWLCVNPSSLEGWGISIIEANACGTPCIGYNVPGIREAIKHGYSGFVVEDFDGLVLGIKRIFEDVNLRNALSTQALVQANEHNWSNSGEKFEKILYENCC